MSRDDLLGPWGETKALEYLRKKHYRPVAMRYKSRFGEIDLIVSSWRYLVFVEVKLRKNADFAQAREFVDRRKQERILATASAYLTANPTRKQPRFDVIEIYAPEGIHTAHPVINHLEDAFQ